MHSGKGGACSIVRKRWPLMWIGVWNTFLHTIKTHTNLSFQAEIGGQFQFLRETPKSKSAFSLTSLLIRFL
jgi:hypothetical protein